MAEAGFGRVLAIGSVQETVPSPNMPIYAMTKAAMANLFSNIAREYAPQGVTFNTLSPGLIETDRNTAKRDDPKRWVTIQQGANPMSRAGTPSETSPSAVHLLSEQASFITGANLVVSGGAHLGRANPADSVRDPIPRRPDTHQSSEK
jgi:NAD(P)-dependent dehydrogenase (short-subunit alcohol dehydrogenase family)